MDAVHKNVDDKEVASVVKGAGSHKDILNTEE